MHEHESLIPHTLVASSFLDQTQSHTQQKKQQDLGPDMKELRQTIGAIGLGSVGVGLGVLWSPNLGSRLPYKPTRYFYEIQT